MQENSLGAEYCYYFSSWPRTIHVPEGLLCMSKVGMNQQVFRETMAMASKHYLLSFIGKLPLQARFSIVLVGASLLLPTAQAQYSLYDRMPNVIEADPAMQGYKVDNKPKRYKVHEELPKRVSLRVAGDIDERYKLATLIADEQGSYENLRVPKIVVVDSVTGEIKPSAYAGSIKCFEGGNLALYVDPGREGAKSFQYGKYGEALQVWEDTLRLPVDKHLNEVSCTIEPARKRQLRDGATVTWIHDLLPEHGKIAVVEGTPRPGNAGDLSADAKALMQQPFMRTMGVSAATEYWVLIKPNGNEISIPNNPGESLRSRWPGFDYLPYLNAYFTAPGIRLMLPETALARPVFGRLIHPDGRVELLGIPDIIQIPRGYRYLGANSVIYTKVGVIWKIEFVRYGASRTDYSGDLEEGYYLQQNATKTLLKLPELAQEKSPKDGCTLKLKEEIVQRRPFLVNTSHINICTGE